MNVSQKREKKKKLKNEKKSRKHQKTQKSKNEKNEKIEKKSLPKRYAPRRLKNLIFSKEMSQEIVQQLRSTKNN